MAKGPWQVQIVTDEIVILLAVARAYRHKSVDVISATKAEQALSQMEVFDFDLFVLDLDIKDGCSFALLQAMTERSVNVPVILMTTQDVQSHALLRQIEQIRRQGCWHLLEKPFQLQKLTGFIERGILERSTFCGENEQFLFMQAHDKRRCRRFSRLEKINLFLADSSDMVAPSRDAVVTLTDISVGGLGVIAKQTLPVGKTVNFDEKFMHQTGIVVWSEGEETGSCRAGIRFN